MFAEEAGSVCAQISYCIVHVANDEMLEIMDNKKQNEKGVRSSMLCHSKFKSSSWS